MEQMAIFHFEDAEVRTVMIDGEPWFVGKDVADALGYERSDNAIRVHVNAEDKLMHQISASDQIRNMTIISEAGIYALVFRSKLPSAQNFSRWVTKEVLPSIRKHGAYMNAETIEKALTNPDTIIQLAQNLKDEQARRERLEEEVTSMHPKANYYDRILKNQSIVNISVIAKDYGMSAITFNELLHKYGIQYKQGKTWLLYQKHATEGYTHSNTHIVSDKKVKITTKWTQKGRIFLYEELKKRGIYPSIEKLGSEGGNNNVKEHQI